MTDVQKIQKSLAKNPRGAYNSAKNSGSACVLNGTRVEVVHKDGSRRTIHQVSQAKVKVDQSRIVFPK